MKNFKHSSLLGLIFILSVFSCHSPSSKTKNDKKIKIAEEQSFSAVFTGTYKYAGPDTLIDRKCEEARVIVDCVGSCNVMGKINVHFDFCLKDTNHYYNLISYMIDAANDTLFLSGEGIVVEGRLEDHPDFVTSYWRDSFKIIGGTGKYKGASGSGETDDYNSSKDAFSHHKWTGIITLLN